MATLQYVVNAIDGASGTFAKIALSAEDLSKQVDDLARKRADIKVGLDDKVAQAGLKDLDLKLTKMKTKVTDPKVTVKGLESAFFGIGRLDVALDKLAAKDVTAKVKVDVDRSALGRLRSWLGSAGFGGPPAGGAGAAVGGAASAAGAGGQGLSALGPWGLAAALGIGGVGIASLLPALLPTLLGGAIGGGGAIGASMIGAKDRAQLQALQKRLAGITGRTAASRASRGRLQDQIAAFQSSHGPQLTIGAAAAAIPRTAEATFFGALTDRPVIRTGGSGPGGHGQVLGQSFLQGLIPVFRQIDRFIKSIGPGLGDMFRASLPFLKLFVTAFEQLAKALLPVVTQSLKQMQPFLPIIGQGLVAVIQGLADMIKAIGPRGMEASARIFMNLCKVMGAALTVFGKALNFIAVAVEATGVWIHKHWDSLRHETAVIFDGMRHEIAHVWDIIYNNSVGAVIHTYRDVMKWWHNLKSDEQTVLTAAGHAIAAVWDTIWRNTVTRTQHAIADIVAWEKTLPGRTIAALRGFGHGLAAFASSAFNEMWNAIKNVAGNIWNWLTSWVSRLPGWLKHLLGIHSPSSVFYDIGKNMMMGLFHGIKDHAQHARSAAVDATRFTGHFGAGVAQWRPDVLRVLGMLGLPFGDAGVVLAQMQTESGGNPNAINLTDSNAAMGDPSRGLMQTIGSTFAAYAGPFRGRSIYDPMANIYAGVNYAIHRYGNPGFLSVLGHGHGYALGGVITEPIWGVGRSGRSYTFGERGPETVTPGTGHRGAPLMVIEHLHVREAADVDLLARRLAFLDN